MDVTLALLCDAANVDADGNLDVRGWFDRISAPAFPMRRPRTCLVLQFGALSAGERRQRPLSVRLLNADGYPIGEVRGSLDISDRGRPAAPAPFHAVVPLPALILPEPGDYSLEAAVDGCQPRSVDLHVTCAESATKTTAASDCPVPLDAGSAFQMSERWGVFDEIAPDSAYFWTREWQAGEREADEDIREGRVISFLDLRWEALQNLAMAPQAEFTRDGPGLKAAFESVGLEVRHCEHCGRLEYRGGEAINIAHYSSLDDDPAADCGEWRVFCRDWEQQWVKSQFGKRFCADDGSDYYWPDAKRWSDALRWVVGRGGR